MYRIHEPGKTGLVLLSWTIYIKASNSSDYSTDPLKDSSFNEDENSPKDEKIHSQKNQVKVDTL